MTPTPISGGETRTGGFTLVELLIAMALVTVIALILFESLRLSSRVWSDSGLAHERITETALVRDWIRRQLTQARPVALSADVDQSTVMFRGEPDAVTFIAAVPAQLGGGGLSRIDLRIIDTEDGRQLVMDRELFHPDLEHRPRQAPRVLVENIEAAKFAYFGAVTPDESATWHDGWLEMDYLPSLVSLRVQFPTDRRQPWPALIAAPMIDGSRSAEFRPVSGTVAMPDG